MSNSKYNHVKSLWKNKQILTEAAMDWKQSYGCFPSISEFTQFINECVGESVFTVNGVDPDQTINENDISRFANSLVVLLEDAADKFAGMSDVQFADWVKSNKGGEEKARKLRAEGQARKTGGTATAEPPKSKPATGAPKAEAPKTKPSAGPAAQGPRDPKARAEWAKASQEEVRRAQAERARQQWSHNKPGAEAPKTGQAAPKAEAPKGQAPKATTPVQPEIDKVGKFLRGAGKFAATVPVVAVGAEAGQQLGAMGAEALGAGSVGKFSSETAGAYYGEKAGIGLVDVGLKKAGFKPTGFKPTVSGAAGMVIGQRAGEAIGGDWSPAIGAMSGALAGEVGERAAMKTAAAQAAKAGVEKIAAKTIGKSLAKKIPGVGLVAGGVLAAERASGGDWLGAAGEALSGLASTVPGVGTAVSAGIDTMLAGKDIATETEKAEDEAMEKAQAEARKKENEKLKAAMKSPTSQAASFERALYGGRPLREGWLTGLVKAVAKTAAKEAGEAAVKTAAKEAGETAIKTAAKEAGEAVAKTAAKETGETVTKTAAKEVGTTTAVPQKAPVAPKPEPKPFAEPPVAKPQTIEIPTTHPIVKVETPAPAPAKTGQIVKADTKIETRPLKSPESTPSAAQTLPANATKTPEQVVTDIVNRVVNIVKSEPPKPKVDVPTIKKPKDIVKPKADDIVKPKADDIVKPKADDIVKPKADDIVKPKADDIVKPKADDVVKPKIDDTPPAKGDVPPIKGDGPDFVPRLPRGGDTPQISTSLAAEPDVPLELAPGERYGVRKRAATYDPFRRMFTTQSVFVSEGKLSPKESLQRKLKKQKYKVSYLQDGKKVEVFASSIRGVRRVLYGKKQYRVHNISGSDVTGYFKKLLGK